MGEAWWHGPTRYGEDCLPGAPAVGQTASMAPSRAEARIAYGCLIAFALVLLFLHAADRRDPRTHFVSEYALHHPALLALGFAAAAGAGLATAVLLARVVGTRSARLAAALLLVFATGMTLLAAFPTARGAPTNATAGRVHGGAADVASLSLVLALILGWAGVSVRALLPLGAGVAAAMTLPRLLAPGWPGLSQRIHWSALFVALVFLIAATNRLPGGRPET